MSLEGLSQSQKDALALGLKALLDADPETSRTTKRMLKKIDPKVFPELEVEDRNEAALAELRKENESLRGEIKEDKFRTQTEKEHARITNRGYKVDDVQKFMTERGIVKFDTAMDVMDMEQRLAVPTPDSATVYDMPGKGEDKDLWNNPAKTARKIAHNLIDQMQRRRA